MDQISGYILNANTNLKALVKNNWIYIIVMDPLADHQMVTYQNDGSWSLLDQKLIFNVAL